MTVQWTCIVFEDEINMDFVNEVEKESDLTAYWGD